MFNCDAMQSTDFYPLHWSTEVPYTTWDVFGGLMAIVQSSGRSVVTVTTCSPAHVLQALISSPNASRPPSTNNNNKP